jgi:predicted RNase H-like HicB family nuclease
MSSERVKLTPVYESVEDGWIEARISEIPQVITCGRDRGEAEAMLRDALREYLLAVEDSDARLPPGVTPDASI